MNRFVLKGGITRAVSVLSYECPNCCAKLRIDLNHTNIICPYCDSPFTVVNENGQIYQHINETTKKRAEEANLFGLKQLENIINEKKSGKMKICMAVVVGGLIVIILFPVLPAMLKLCVVYGLLLLGLFKGITLYEEYEKKSMEKAGKVKVPFFRERDKANYTILVTLFSQAGFNNIQCKPLHDLKVGLFKNEGSVASISIAGESVTSGGDKYFKNSPIVIYYHSF